jgi:hypothetical protein
MNWLDEQHDAAAHHASIRVYLVEPPATRSSATLESTMDPNQPTVNQQPAPEQQPAADAAPTNQQLHDRLLRIEEWFDTTPAGKPVREAA